MNPFDVNASPITEPESLLVGSYKQWRRLLDYDDANYSLSYRFVPQEGGTVQNVAGTFDASNEWWVFEITTVDLASWSLGAQRWDLLLERLSDNETVSLATGSLTLHATNQDRRTHAEIMVEKIESLLVGRAATDIESYTIKSRSLTKMSIKELREWREYYLAEIEQTGGSTTGSDTPKKNTLRVRWV